MKKYLHEFTSIKVVKEMTTSEKYLKNKTKLVILNSNTLLSKKRKLE